MISKNDLNGYTGDNLRLRHIENEIMLQHEHGYKRLVIQGNPPTTIIEVLRNCGYELAIYETSIEIRW